MELSHGENRTKLRLSSVFKIEDQSWEKSMTFENNKKNIEHEQTKNLLKQMLNITYIYHFTTWHFFILKMKIILYSKYPPRAEKQFILMTIEKWWIL